MTDSTSMMPSLAELTAGIARSQGLRFCDGPFTNSCTRVTRANGLESGLTAMATFRYPTRDQSSELYKPGAARSMDSAL